MINADFFADSLKKLGPFPKGTSFVIASSGGADSLCLTHLMHRWAKVHGHFIMTLTIDHQLRPESTSEAQQVAELMHEWGIAHHISTWKHDQNISFSQADARQARYNLIEDFCQARQIQYVLLGHHGDDQLETFFMRFSHASGPEGLSCIAPCLAMNTLILLRPLLSVKRKHILDYLNYHQLSWVEDPSNASPKYQRTVLREFIQLLPRYNLNKTRMLTTIQKIQQDNHDKKTILDFCINQAILSKTSESVVLSREVWEKWPYALKKQTLKFFLKSLHPTRYLSRHIDSKIDHLVLRLQNAHPYQKFTLNHCLIHLKKDILKINVEYRKHSSEKSGNL